MYSLFFGARHVAAWYVRTPVIARRANARAWLHDCAAGLQARVAFCMFLNANYVRVLIIGTFFRNKKKEIEHNFFFHGGNYAYIFG